MKWKAPLRGEHTALLLSRHKVMSAKVPSTPLVIATVPPPAVSRWAVAVTAGGAEKGVVNTILNSPLEPTI